MLNPVVHDLAHFNDVNFTQFQAAGGKGIIHKASQGVGMTDQMYPRRRAAWAAAGGKLWGAYSFATADDPIAHARHFLAVAAPDANTLCALDYEENPHSPMSAQQAWDFMREVEHATGRLCWLYGGSLVAEEITPLCVRSSAAAEFFAARPLWLPQYKTGLGDVTLAELRPRIRVPGPWKDWTLLQYTGDGVGPLPHGMPGTARGADLNVFDGDAAALAAAWAGAALPVAA